MSSSEESSFDACSDTEMSSDESDSAQLQQKDLPEDRLKAIINKAACKLGFKRLEEEQRSSILQFARGKDVFVSLPTGYGKSLCYIALPKVFDKIRKVRKKSIILVVSPLIALMRDQIASLIPMGLKATHISDREVMSAEHKKAIKNGEFQVLFISPEALLSLEWRSMLSTKVYKENLMAFVVDEAHCIKKWYDCFLTQLVYSM